MPSPAPGTHPPWRHLGWTLFRHRGTGQTKHGKRNFVERKGRSNHFFSSHFLDLKGRSWKMGWKRIGNCLYTGKQPSEVVGDTWLKHNIGCGKKWRIHQEFLEFPHLKSGSHKHLAMSKAKKYLPKTIFQTSTFLYVVTSCDVLVNLKISKNQE